MQPDTTKQTVEAYFEALSRLDAEAWIGLFAETAISRDPVDARPWEGKDALAKFFARMRAALQSIEMVPDEVYVRGNFAAVRWHGRAWAKDGQKMASFGGIDTFEVDPDGRLVRVDAYWHPEEMMRQLGD
jgi:steroid delta-isomerase-like uncharacterized protein